jgi:type II secretory pathway pseudopilin PulG
MEPTITRRESGLSLVELLVAVTILALATTVAFVVYDEARQSYKQGENITEQQQAVRVAQQILASDIRMAGFNTNPDGNRVRPDEQIEAASPTSIVIRGDYDYQDPTEAAVPESSLAGGAFLSVTTGNDEIRAFVLAKSDSAGRSGPETLSFWADVQEAQRDGDVEEVRIDDVVLDHDGDTKPPYTLYRITLDDSGLPVSTVMIENVRRMNFRYYDLAGNELPAVGGADSETDKLMRAAIRRVGIEIEALTRDPDPEWRDLDDPDPATRPYRKFRLESDITPRNLGWSGIRDYLSDSLAPSAPSLPQLDTGHCGGLFLSWPPNPPEDEEVYYRVLFGTDPADLNAQRSTPTPAIFLGGLQQATQYYVALQAVDAAGNIGPPSGLRSAVTVNTNTPETPLNPTATQDLNGRVELAWDEVRENADITIEAGIQTTQIRELAGYRVYRSENSGFTPGPGNRIADESVLPALEQPQFVDNDVVNCELYHYRVAAADFCGSDPETESVRTAEFTGTTDSNVAPEAPLNVEAFLDGVMRFRLIWDVVRYDVGGTRIRVDDYSIFRTGFLPAGTNPGSLSDADFTYIATVTNATEYIDDPVPVPFGQTFFYRVKAIDACSPPNTSGASQTAEPQCVFSGTVNFQAPSYNTVVWPSDWIDVVVQGGAGNYTQLRLEFFHQPTSRVVDNVSISGPGPAWSHQWVVNPSGIYLTGGYTVTAEVDQDYGFATCSSSTSTRLIVKTE